MKEKEESISILDLPEPVRARSLRALGMTAEEFASYQAGREANIREFEEMTRLGEVPAVDGMHYDDSIEGFPEAHPVL